MILRTPYLLFLGDAEDGLAAKTAAGIAYWRPDRCAGQLRLPGCRADLGLPDLTLEDAATQCVGTLVIGLANRGGSLAANWIAPLARALELGLDVASGLHRPLAEVPELAAAAARSGRRLVDVRLAGHDLPVGNGAPRAGRRLLTVGTDCSVGKMYTALALERELRRRGIPADFRATGQTGILIAGAGIAIDAVAADFISGAVERLAPAAAPDHWDVIEGQGSLFYPSYAGVSLGLLHGAQAEAIVLCHEPTRSHMRGLPDRPLPPLGPCLADNLAAGRLTSPAIRCAGISMNTAGLDAAAAESLMKRTEDAFGLPCVDPVRGGVGALAARL